MITLLIIVGLIIAGLINCILGAGIMQFGDLISKTPDMLERHGERKELSDAPKRHADVFAVGLCVLYFVGVLIVIMAETTQLLIIGGVVVFSALLFSGTILGYSIMIYNLMKKNQRELKDSVVA